MRQIAIPILSGLISFANAGCDNGENNTSPLVLNPVSHVEKNAGLEISGLAKSRSHTDVYWAVNDSGNPAVVVPLSPEGKVVSASGKGITITDAQNIDWESLAMDLSGHLYICDTGNNNDSRKELQIYRIREPSLAESSTDEVEIIRIRYPNRNATSSKKMLYDCEAAFVFKRKLYLLTKQRHDLATSLYRLDRHKKNSVNTLTYVSTFPIGGYVTAADISPDMQRLAVLTYRTLWLFYDFPNDDFFSGPKKQIRLKGGGQIEAIVFANNEELMLVNETRNEIFRVTLPVR